MQITNQVHDKSLTRFIETNNKYIDLLNYASIKISGEKAESFLQGQFTCDVTKITATRGTLGALCNHQGRVLAIFWLLKKENYYYCILPSSLAEDFIQHLTKFAVFSKVLLELVDDIYLYGCVGIDVAQFLTQKNFPIPTANYEIVESNGTLIFNVSSILPRFLILSSEIFGPNEITIEDESWKLANILSGQPIIYPETKGIVTPHMLNLHHLDAISFNKGCYVGQEIVARTHYLGKSKRHLCRAKVFAEIDLLSGETIYTNQQEVGVLIESVIVGSMTIVLAVLQDPLDRQLIIQDHELEEVVKLEY